MGNRLMSWYKIAKKMVSPKEMKDLHSLIKKIMEGKRNWSPQELQLQQNFPELVEKKLMEKYHELV